MAILEVRHRTTYTYRRPVRLGEHRILFRPRDSHDQRLLDYSLSIAPEPTGLHWIHDSFGNCVAIATFRADAAELRFDSYIALDHKPQSGLRLRLSKDAKSWPLLYDDETLPDLAASMRRHHPDDGEIERWAMQFINAGRRTDVAHLLASMTQCIFSEFAYARRLEQGTKPPLETLRSKAGSCRDLALFMMEAARSLGLAARFVTGYVYVPGNRARAVDSGGATHAWVQVFLTGAGWIEFDPTNGIVGNRDLIRIGVARAPQQALPLHGTYLGESGDALGMAVDVRVLRRRAEPALRLPSLWLRED